MIIGTDQFKPEEFKRYVMYPEEVVAYSDNSIPLWARHIPNIQNNQRYYYAVKVRGMLSIPFKQRSKLIDVLTDGISISGAMDRFIPIMSVIMACDKDTLVKLLEEKLKE